MDTWLLLRGLTRGSGHWSRFHHTLGQRLAGARVVTIDVPGNGALHALRSPDRIEAMTAHCRAQAAALGLAPPYHLLAVSLGGMVAVDWATRAPDELTGCVLVNTSLRGINPWTQRLRPSAWPLLLRAVTATSAAERERAILRLTSRNAAVAVRVLPVWTALRQTQPVSAVNALRQLWAAAQFTAPETPPSVPLLVLSSAGDALVDPRCSLAISERWQASSAQHPWAGHDLTLDDGAWVAERVADWLDRPTVFSRGNAA